VYLTPYERSRASRYVRRGMEGKDVCCQRHFPAKL
jgi:hypothetical protein